MRTLVLSAALVNGFLAMALAAPLAAQEAPETANSSQLPEVVIKGWRRDRAMDAFIHGDFETAEVEFSKNVRCIRRIELALDAALAQGALDRSRYGIFDAPVHNLPMHDDEIAERTCHSKQWQLYMIGLSQIQLGRFDDAKKSLYRVTRMSKEDLLYDAHYRVALLELLDGDVERADRRLAHLISMQRSCHNRGMRCDLHADMDAAVGYLQRAVANARRDRAAS